MRSLRPLLSPLPDSHLLTLRELAYSVESPNDRGKHSEIARFLIKTLNIASDQAEVP